ncbi:MULTISPECIES: glutaredoxin family protein [unclassified Undibacterium]|uniref:glutaredoxin family protein n=1 Tax=unclassified Undibacterium TaxID=2630295 RepID=UPI002AC91721|nr:MULTISPECIES: glutaredoxin family protein [unclassified Undibacterium]MEB0138577.1 glutaredoxin family protein [Undibacterium sp. CCC2.1]MEB0171359.1 glutaredoxin family protein [Undibacterium sp. CCC1.1]MEB0175341.1 glutaredoxin family protein [Undibacterium sp. CCC3.4]MEB0214555.1 glutaredoxin family protein [Undibacterium sp. 5I2]WPX43070.1 glutaredoxin family protein [Undibacterium sp. CCC3.4]
MTVFTLYSRSYCHLCDDMLAQLQTYRSAYAFTVQVIDVDGDAELLNRYDELVPVLIAAKPGQAARQICHYFLDTVALHNFFAA